MEFKKYFLSSEIENALPNKAKYHIIPVPYEKSVSYGSGTAFGPAALIEASEQLEVLESYTQTMPALKGIHTQDFIDCQKAADIVMEDIEKAALFALKNKAKPVIIGGEHTVSFGGIKACSSFYNDIGIIHFDAHADLRFAYEGNKWSHASVMHRALELHIPLAQFGTRAYSLEEKKVREKFQVIFYDAHTLHKMSTCSLPHTFPKKIYLSFDIDALDPSIVPHTGTPVPGGLNWYQSLDLIKNLLKDREIIGLDLVELAPQENSQVSNFTAAYLLYQLLGICEL